MIRRARGQDGWAVVTAVMVMSLMVSIGLATYAYVDTQVRASSKSRARESTFNYDEGVLNAQQFTLSQSWAGGTATQYPDCSFNGTSVSSTNGDVSRCPTQALLAQTFTNKDYNAGVTWTVKVRDNAGASPCLGLATSNCGYYWDTANESGALAAAHYDANGDHQLWVRARTVVGGRARTLVARVEAQKQALDFPRAVVSANTFTIAGSPKLKTYTNGATIKVRCPAAQSGNPKGCVSSKRTDQVVTPDQIVTTDNSPALTPTGLQQMRERAQAEGSYYSTCPTSPPGPLVFIEAGNCGPASLPPTSASNPGTVIIVSGTLNINGAGDYWGLIYLANAQGSTASNVFDSNGNHRFHGSIVVDGGGGVTLGTSSNTSLAYDGGAFSGLYAYANASLVRPSFREIQSSTP